MAKIFSAASPIKLVSPCNRAFITNFTVEYAPKLENYIQYDIIKELWRLSLSNYSQLLLLIVV